MKTKSILLVFAILVVNKLSLTYASSTSVNYIPGDKQNLPVKFINSPPNIDGIIDEWMWQQSAIAKNFRVSSLQTGPQESTEVMVLSDETNLYVAFRCYDSSPESISAMQLTRDGKFGYDDFVTVQLDTFHNHRNISSYSVNAAGTQRDEFAGGRADKIEWKGDWRAKVQKTEYGWSAEIAIPFRILNFDPKSEIFGVNFLRHHHRTKELSYWADITPQMKNENMGQLVGLALPEKVKDKTWTLMPYIFMGKNIVDKEGDRQDELYNAGIDIRNEPSPYLTALYSINPDFSQLEKQVTDIDFSYTEKEVDDPRPFFQEGSRYFGSDTRYFYSNRVPDFDAGAKVFYHKNDNQFATFLTRAPDDRWDAAVRYNADLDATHNISTMLISSRREELDNDVAVISADGRQPFGLYYGLDIANSSTDSDEDIGSGESYEGSLGWQGNYYSLGSKVNYFDPGFYPANGLMKDDLVNTKGKTDFISYNREFSDGFVRSLSGDISHSKRKTMDDLLQSENWYVGGTVESKHEISTGLYYFEGDYRPVINGSRGQFSNTLNDDHYYLLNLDFNTRSSLLGYGISYASGSLGSDDYRYGSAYAWMKPSVSTFINLSAERLDNFGEYYQTIVSGGWNITRTQGISGRFISADYGEQLRLAYRRQIRNGVDIFAVYENIEDEPEQVSLKFVWTHFR